jgi:tRNA A-37 threonylcarbamoyl transferase component Bud32
VDTEDAEGTSATVADRPGAKQAAVASPTVVDVIAPGALASIGGASPKQLTLSGPSRHGSSMSLTTAADALRDEEVERTRKFIVIGWGISIATIGSVPMLPSPFPLQIAMVFAMVLGIVVSSFFYRAFSDPRRYTEAALLKLALLCIVNSNVAVLYYGAFTVAPSIIVVGIHFVARTEAIRTARTISATAFALYAVIATAIISGLISDPGVFRTDAALDRRTMIIGALFVLATYVLAYATARAFRRASLASIDDLQKATRLASQREALLDELRADLERALRVGGPGRHSEQVVGGFRLGIVLGRGAMGEVYEATSQATGERVAVKLLRRELLADPTHVARFLREVRASAALQSPHVVRVLDASADSDTLPYLAMERLQGHTLAHVLRRDSRLPPADVVELVRHAGAGIDAAAAAGIVHRDLKPQNLFRSDAGWKILDFGVATLAEDSGTLTQGGIVGTPNYMAPEQAQGQRVDSRADVYALAAVAYRCLTGRHPFTGSDTPALLYAVVHRMPPRPGEVTELHADVDAWFAVAIAKAPGDRFKSGAQLADALVASLAGQLDPAVRRRAEGLLRRHPWEVA